MMRVFATALVLAVMGLGTAFAAQDEPREEERIRVIPVKTATQVFGDTINVCMYSGARPRPYRVVKYSCRGGASYCSAFVAVENDEADILLMSFDLEFPPVEATGSTCNQPAPPPTGQLQPLQ